MVYCGKPSKGCKTCRERKIRCNQAIPTCGQCAKANKVCPGYRNQIDLAFRNESSSVIQKAKAKARKNLASTKQPPPSQKATVPKAISETAICHALTGRASPASFYGLDYESYVPSGSFDDWTPDPAFPISTFSIHPTVEELGTNYFVSNYILPPSGPSHGFFSYVSDLCREEGVDDTLRASMNAVGLAGYANINKSPQLLGKAWTEYQVALRKINAALQFPEFSIKNGTLLAIMVVSVFETITGSNRFSLKAWTEHINGATTLLKLRGPSQLATAVGTSLFIHVTCHLLISCVQREIPMPPWLLELRREAFNNRQFDLAYQFLELMDRFTIYRAALKNGDIQDPLTIITMALKFDADAKRIFSDVPSEWLYETVHNDHSSEMAYNGSYDIYYDVWVAQIWNAMRLCRIILNENIRTRILAGFTSVPPLFTSTEYTAQYQLSTEVLVEMRDGILRSVPQHFGHITRKPFSQPSDIFDGTSFTDLLNDCSNINFSHYDSPRSSPPPRPPTAAMGGHFLLWPLYVSGITRINIPATRELVYTRLRYIGDTMGIMQGIALADFLKAGAVLNNKDSAKRQESERILVNPSLLRWRERMAEVDHVHGDEDVHGMTPYLGTLGASHLPKD